MIRKTVTITTPDSPEPRDFHLHADKAIRFAADIVAKGGTASIGPLKMSDGLKGVLARAGVNPAVVK